ncbi:hypothetical protein [Nonomuraea salmonea]|uniref:hypothetical protein n=1 Tax=Nonomuraea salmonea TaxID=46181 RepID=UPI0031F11A64
MVTKTMETRNRRASARRRDASLMSTPSTRLTPATRMISQKWLGLCCHGMLMWSLASSSQRPSMGSARWIPPPDHAANGLGGRWEVRGTRG